MNVEVTIIINDILLHICLVGSVCLQRDIVATRFVTRTRIVIRVINR